jgi:hypothetical protein
MARVLRGNGFRYLMAFWGLAAVLGLSSCGGGVSDGSNTKAATAVKVTPDTTTFSENGGSGSFTVALATKPDAAVVVDVSSTDTTEAEVDKDNLTFTPENWSTPQVVMVYGVNDPVADGNQIVDIVLEINAGDTRDPNYRSLAASAVPNISVTVTDNDEAGVTVTVDPDDPNIKELTFPESEWGFFTVELNTKPDGDVVLNISSSDTTEATVDTDTLTFTTENWSTAQEVTVFGVDDSIVDGSQKIDIVMDVDAAKTTDTTGYADLTASRVDDVTVTVTDDDAVGVTVTPTELNFSENESGFFTVELNTKPDDNVVIKVKSNDTTEAMVNGTELIELTFNADGWFTPRTVIVAGVDDSATDGNQDITIEVDIDAAKTADPKYADLASSAVNDVKVKVRDNDAAGVTVTPTELQFSENKGSDTFDVVLNMEPSGNVVVNVSSSDTTEAKVNGTELIELTFDSADWKTPHTVTVDGVDDSVTDGNQDITIVVDVDAAKTADPKYADLASSAVDDVKVMVLDDDNAGVTVTPTELNFRENESGSFTVELNMEPSGNVVIDVYNKNESEAKVDNSELVFKPADWKTPHTVTVDGVDDSVTDGNQEVDILVDVNAAKTADPKYATLASSAVDDVKVTVRDDDDAGVTVTPTELQFSENKGSDTFDVVLNMEPSGNVVVNVSSSDTTEATVNESELIELTFNVKDWSTPQEVKVAGVDDSVTDGNQDITIEVDVNAAKTADPKYATLASSAVDDVKVMVLDDDNAGVTVTPTELNFRENESGSFTVELNMEPSGNVVIDVSSSDTTEATVDKGMLLFTSKNWSTPQKVNVSGVDDQTAGENPDITIVVSVDAGYTDDFKYADLPLSAVPDVSVTLTDDDKPSVTVTPNSLNFPEGKSESFSVGLNTEPDGEVVINVTSKVESEAMVDKGELIFKPANWSPQTVIVSGVDDQTAGENPDITIEVDIDAAKTTDTTGYAEPDVVVDDVTVKVIDNDNPGVTVTPGEITFPEGKFESFAVMLNTEPSGNVVIDVSSSDTTKVIANKEKLTFDFKDWTTPKTVTVYSADELIFDVEPILATINLGINTAETFDTTGYDSESLEVPDVSVTVTDDGVP